MNKQICLEWHSWSGKTSNAKNLEEKGIIKRFGEYFHYINEGEEYPGTNPKNERELMEIRKHLFELLERRDADILRYKENSPVLIERSPLSFIYTETLRIHTWLFWNLKTLAIQLQQVLSMSQEPDYYIFLQLDSLLAKKRLQERINSDKLFYYKKNVLIWMEKILEFFRSEYLSTDNYSIINTDRTKDEVEWELIQIIKNLKEKWLTQQNAITKLCNHINKWLDLLTLL